MYLREGALHTHKSDHVVNKCRFLRRGLQERAIIVSLYISDGYLRVSAGGAANWCRLLDNVAIIIIVDLLYD